MRDWAHGNICAMRFAPGFRAVLDIWHGVCSVCSVFEGVLASACSSRHTRSLSFLVEGTLSSGGGSWLCWGYGGVQTCSTIHGWSWLMWIVPGPMSKELSQICAIIPTISFHTNTYKKRQTPRKAFVIFSFPVNVLVRCFKRSHKRSQKHPPVQAEESEALSPRGKRHKQKGKGKDQGELMHNFEHRVL